MCGIQRVALFLDHMVLVDTEVARPGNELTACTFTATGFIQMS